MGVLYYLFCWRWYTKSCLREKWYCLESIASNRRKYSKLLCVFDTVISFWCVTINQIHRYKVSQEEWRKSGKNLNFWFGGVKSVKYFHIKISETLLLSWKFEVKILLAIWNDLLMVIFFFCAEVVAAVIGWRYLSCTSIILFVCL